MIKGSYFDTEFDAIATAIATKHDSGTFASQAQAEALSSETVVISPHSLNDVLVDNAGMLGNIQALTDPGADVLLGWDDSASAAIGFTLGTGLESSGTALQVTNADITITESQISDLQSYLLNIVEDTTPQLGADLECQGRNLQTVGVIMLKEQADADADVAGEGQLWVNTASPNELYFTDDAGSDWPLAGANIGAGGITKVKEADEAISSDSTLSDDSDLAGFNLVAGAYYKVEGYLEMSTGTSADFKMQLDFSQTPQNDHLRVEAAYPGASSWSSAGSTLAGYPIANSSFSSGVQHGIMVSGHFQANASTGGDVSLQWAQNTSNAASTTLHDGSWMTITRIK